MALFASGQTQKLFSTGFSSLDNLLAGGFAAGQITEISGKASSGKSTLAFNACLSVLKEGRAAAWIDSGSHVWPIAALEAQLPLEKFLVLRVRDGKAAFRGAHLLLSSPGAVATVVVELPCNYRPADTNLIKLQRLAARSGTALIFLTEGSPTSPSIGSAVALRLGVNRRFQPFTRSFSLEVKVVRHKGGANHQTLEESLHGPNRLCIHSSL